MISRYAERQITSVQQYRGEPLSDYLYYFNSLLEKYPDHGLNNYDILDSFLRGMDPVWYNRMQCAAGHWRLEDLYVEEVWDLIDHVAGIVRTSDLQHDQGNEEDTVSRDEFNALVQKVEEQSGTLKEISKQMSEILTTLLEKQEAERLEREQEEQIFGEETEAIADQDSLASVVIQEPDLLPLIADPLPLFPVQVSRQYDREDLVLLSEVGTRVSNNGPMIEDVSTHSMPYKKRKLAHAYKEIHGGCGRELDWERIEVVLPYKRCHRKRYVEIHKYDHTYPWEPGL